MRVHDLKETIYMALPKEYIVQANDIGKQFKYFFMQSFAKDVFIKNNPKLGNCVVLYNEIKSKKITFVIPNKRVVYEHVLPQIIKTLKLNLYFYNEDDLVDVNGMQIHPVHNDEIDIMRIYYQSLFGTGLDSLDIFVEKLKKNQCLKKVSPAFVIGEPSSGTMYIYKLIEEIIFQNHKCSFMIRNLLRNLSNIETINGEKIKFNIGGVQKQYTAEFDDIYSLLICGWSHENPKNIVDTKFDQKINKVYVHRDGRDVVASITTAFSISKEYKKEDCIDIYHDNTPAYYGCTQEDMRFSFLNIYYFMKRWFDSTMGFYNSSEKFLELRFENFTIDRENKNNIVNIIKQLTDLLGYSNDEEIIYNTVQGYTISFKGEVSLRKGYTKIERYKQIFEKNEIDLMNSFLAIPLDLLGYEDINRYKNKKFTVLFDAGENSTLQYAKFIFAKYDICIEDEIEIKNIKNISEDKEYLVFSKNTLDISKKENVFYFCYYDIYRTYIPYVFHLVLKEKIMLNQISKENVLVIYNDMLIIHELIKPIVNRILEKVDFISIEELQKADISQYDYILNAGFYIKMNYEVVQKLICLNIQKDKILSFFPLYEDLYV